MNETASISLKREVHAITIPDGVTTTLAQGEIVTLHQNRGGTFTVATERGYLLRIDGADADALGLAPVSATAQEGDTDPESVEKNAWEVMRNVYDPEIPVNIVDLGLVYRLSVTPAGPGRNHVEVVMTLTAPGCGMGPILQSDVELGIKKLPGVESVTVEVVFDPPWSMDKMSEVAKVQLGMI